MRMGDPEQTSSKASTSVNLVNAAFAEPVVMSARGGAEHGGASLTATGRAVLDTFRRLEARLATADALAEIEGLRQRMRPGLGEGPSD